MAIPKIVHFCFGMSPDFGGRPFSLCHYLSVRSAWEVLKPDCMMMHCAHEPQGEWWELAKPMLQLHQVNPVSGIYGFPAAHPAHRADIIRLAALKAMGGIYLDTDVLVVRPFDPLLEDSFVAAREATADGTQVGLSNAILLAEADARFTDLCLEGHDPRKSLWQGFRSRGRDENYIEYSVRYPCMLADLCPGMLKTLPPESFLWATWDQAGLQGLFEEDRNVPEQVFALHLWESHAWEKYLSKLTPEGIRNTDTTFNRLARPFLPDTAAAGSLVRSTLPNPSALARMDEICKDADFISAQHQAPGSAFAKARQWARRTLRDLRNEILLPLRCVQERMEQRLEAHLRSHGPPPLENPASDLAGNMPLLRFGPLDGSRALLERVLKSPPHGDIRCVMVTGASAEPGVCSWLASQPNARGVWVSGSLPRAKQLAEWSADTGSMVRCIHADPRDEELRLPEGLFPEKPTVLILAGIGRELQQWEDWKNSPPEIILAACNPLLDEDCVPSKGGERQPSGHLWGASKAAFLDLAARRSYALLAESPDGLFLVFGRHAGGESEVPVPSDQEIQSFVRVRTLYGQFIHIPKSAAQAALGFKK